MDQTKIQPSQSCPQVISKLYIYISYILCYVYKLYLNHTNQYRHPRCCGLCVCSNVHSAEYNLQHELCVYAYVYLNVYISGRSLSLYGSLSCVSVCSYYHENILFAANNKERKNCGTLPSGKIKWSGFRGETTRHTYVYQPMFLQVLASS